MKPKKLQFLDFEKEVLEEEWDRQGEQHFAVRLLPKPEYINECLAYSQVEENIADEKGGFFLGWARMLERTFGNLHPENLTKGRAQMPHTKLAKLKAARRSTTDHMFKDTCLAAWHALAARLAELSQLLQKVGELEPSEEAGPPAGSSGAEAGLGEACAYRLLPVPAPRLPPPPPETG